jgi:hypothetical protein
MQVPRDKRAAQVERRNGDMVAARVVKELHAQERGRRERVMGEDVTGQWDVTKKQALRAGEQVQASHHEDVASRERQARG